MGQREYQVPGTTGSTCTTSKPRLQPYDMHNAQCPVPGDHTTTQVHTHVLVLWHIRDTVHEKFFYMT